MKEEYNSMNIQDYDNQQQNNQILKCPNCGQDVGDWVFCFYCGTNLKAQTVNELPNEETEQSESEIDNTPDDTIDIQQETTEVKAPSCPNCGKEIGEWDFCFHCGTNLKAQSIDELPSEEAEQLESAIGNTSDDTIDSQQETTEVKAPSCPNCGKEIGEWDFCFHCGTNLKAQSIDELPSEETEQSESEIDNTPDYTIDIQQETMEVKTPVCPNCGKEIGEWDFCFHCGTNLKEQPLSEISDTNTEDSLKDIALVTEEDSERKDKSIPYISETTSNEPELSETNENIIILVDENGNELEFIFLDLIQYRNKEYVVLLPNDDSVELVTILQFEESPDGTERYSSVENDFTLQVVFEIFKERAKNDFNFTD